MRPERVAKLLRLGCEPGAVVDDRPAARRFAGPWVRGFILGILVGALIACAYFLWRVDQLIPETPPYLHERR